MKFKEPQFWWNYSPSPFVKFISYPWGIIFKILIKIRYRISKKAYSSKPIICVGNFVIGGQGKTPFVRYIRKRFIDLGLNSAVISRGYRSRFNSTKIVQKDDSALEYGDEAILHSNDGLTIVSKNREEALSLLEEKDCDLIILDDGFQNPSVNKDVNIVLVDISRGLGNNLLIPFGPMRENFDFGIKRADLIIYVNSTNEIHESIEFIKRYWNGPSIEAEYLTYTEIDLNEEVIVFSGLSNPSKLIYGLKKMGTKINEHFIYADHEEVNEKNAEKILKCSKRKNLQIVTTEKDLIKLRYSEKGSYREKLFLASICAKIKIKLDDRILIEFLHEKKII